MGINFKNGGFFLDFLQLSAFRARFSHFRRHTQKGKRGEHCWWVTVTPFMCHHFVLESKQVLTSIKHSLDLPLRGLFKAKPSVILTKTVGCSQSCRQDRAVDGCGQSHIVMRAVVWFICSSNSSSRGWFTSSVSSCLLQGCPFFFH